MLNLAYIYRSPTPATKLPKAATIAAFGVFLK